MSLAHGRCLFWKGSWKVDTSARCLELTRFLVLICTRASELQEREEQTGKITQAWVLSSLRVPLTQDPLKACAFRPRFVECTSRHYPLVTAGQLTPSMKAPLLNEPAAECVYCTRLSIPTQMLSRASRAIEGQHAEFKGFGLCDPEPPKPLN